MAKQSQKIKTGARLPKKPRPPSPPKRPQNRPKKKRGEDA